MADNNCRDRANLFRPMTMSDGKLAGAERLAVRAKFVAKYWPAILRGSGAGFGRHTARAPAHADGHLCIRWAKGVVALMEASAEEYVEKCRFALHEAQNSSGGSV